MDTATTQAQSPVMSWLVIIIMFAALYLLFIRPQNKREKEQKKMRSELKPGDKIITIGGICGTVARVKEDSDRVVIMVGSDRVKMEILKNAIANVDTGEEVAAGGKTVKAEDKETVEATKPNKKNIKKLGSNNKVEAKEEAPAEKAE